MVKVCGEFQITFSKFCIDMKPFMKLFLLLPFSILLPFLPQSKEFINHFTGNALPTIVGTGFTGAFLVVADKTILHSNHTN